ncbi:hypothetical protein NPIL_645721 [Nephila pilipes]|uniref:Uncharacterized protein n=1 Tax=Nephila pilipes TaxID=299642 RepID=A0A8X6TTU3_NEPPI|nr:hypothetical protein NPIL_645721 [Nephila pilipes]
MRHYEFTSTTVRILKAAALHLRKLETNFSELRKLWIKNGCKNSEENTNCRKGIGWSLCCSSDNPAYLTTTRESAGKILSCTLWWSGPAWLFLPILSWPCRDLQYSLEGVWDADMVGRKQRTTQVNSMMANSGGETSLLLLLNVNEFSELGRLLHITA